MSGSVVDLFFDENRNKWRWFWGKETFYDEDNTLIEFESSIDALSWMKQEHPELTIRYAGVDE